MKTSYIISTENGSILVEIHHYADGHRYVICYPDERSAAYHGRITLRELWSMEEVYHGETYHDDTGERILYTDAEIESLLFPLDKEELS